jgi:hypothetical protein
LCLNKDEPTNEATDVKGECKEARQVKDTSSPSTEAQSGAIKYCGRCARRSPTLFFDDLTLQELCQECWDRLKRKREMAFRPAKPQM